VLSRLASQGVERWERKMFAGHARPDGGSTDEYTHYDPKYLRNAAEAIERMFEALSPLTQVNVLGKVLEEQPGPPEASWLLAWLAQGGDRWMRGGLVGASGIEPPTPCLSSRCSTAELRAYDPNPVGFGGKNTTDSAPTCRLLVGEGRELQENQLLTPYNTDHVKE
jgi:hypothetical protein